MFIYECVLYSVILAGRSQCGQQKKKQDLFFIYFGRKKNSIDVLSFRDAPSLFLVRDLYAATRFFCWTRGCAATGDMEMLCGRPVRSVRRAWPWDRHRCASVRSTSDSANVCAFRSPSSSRRWVSLRSSSPIRPQGPSSLNG